MTGRSYFFRSRRGLPAELRECQLWIEGIAKGYGLDFCETVFEMCDYDEINMIAAYGGFPTRYPHWRWGMEYLQMQKGYEYGLQKIYEMVINTRPAYAYLLDNNTMMDQKLVMAHVFGHVDFFTNNCWFSPTNRKMLDQMANHAARIRRYIDRHGVAEVEAFTDLCLSIDNLIDPFAPVFEPARRSSERDLEDAALSDGVVKLPARSYMDRYINPPDYLEAQRVQHRASMEQMKRFPERPTRDVAGFILKHGKLAGWQQDVLGIILAESYYFAPQGQTKIMNEGWASYWHTTMMTQNILTDAEVIDYCDHHSGTVAMQPGQINPYKIGIELFRDIEERWNRGQFGKEWLDCEDVATKRDWNTDAGLGREKIFEVRRSHNDITFIDTFLTADFVRKNGLFTYEFDRSAGHFVVDTREFEAVKQKLLFMLSNRGQPRIEVRDGNHANRGELELGHIHEGSDIQVDWASQTLRNLSLLWGRPVHLRTTVDDKPVTLSHDGTTFKAEGLKGRRRRKK